MVNVDVRNAGMGLDDSSSAGLYASSTPLTVVGGTFSGNAAKYGGSIYADDAYQTSRLALHVSGATFRDNKARGVLAPVLAHVATLGRAGLAACARFAR